MTDDGLFGELLTWTGLKGPVVDHSRGVDRSGTQAQAAEGTGNGARGGVAAPAKPFVPPPWPFDSRPEAKPEPAEETPPPVPFVPTPLPFAPGRHTFAPDREPVAPPRAAAATPAHPAAPPPRPAASPPRPFGLQQWLFGTSSAPAAAPPMPAASPPMPAAAPPAPRAPVPRPQATPSFAAPPWPFDSPPEPVDEPQRRAPLPFVPTPLPFAPTRHTFDAHHEAAVALPKPARRSGPRLGQSHAEAAARAARFVASHHAEPAPRAGIRPSAKPASVTPLGLSPQGAALIRAAQAYGAGPALAPTPTPTPASSARAAAFERAMARGRALGESAPKPPKAHNEIDSDETALGVTVVLILFAEIFGGVVAFALPSSYVVLALGFALDGCARMLGTVAATRGGKDWGPGWRWACALVGSPAVATFAFHEDESVVRTELAPLAGGIALLATVCLVVGLAGIPAGI